MNEYQQATQEHIAALEARVAELEQQRDAYAAMVAGMAARAAMLSGITGHPAIGDWARAVAFPQVFNSLVESGAFADAGVGAEVIDQIRKELGIT